MKNNPVSNCENEGWVWPLVIILLIIAIIAVLLVVFRKDKKSKKNSNGFTPYYRHFEPQSVLSKMT